MSEVKLNILDNTNKKHLDMLASIYFHVLASIYFNILASIYFDMLASIYFGKNIPFTLYKNSVYYL